MAASMLDVWIDEFCHGTNEIENISSICEAVEQGEIEFHVFVEKLGPFLASPEVVLRQMGTSLFVKVLKQIPRDTFNENQVQLIVEFLCQRVKEQHSVIPYVLQGVEAVSAYKHLPKGSVQKLLQSMFQTLYVPSLLQPERLCIYNTFARFIEHHLQELHSLGSEFILGFIQVLDGERDPRCLVMAFTIVPVIIQNFELGALDEEFFEVISCYFPVDFTPSPSDSQVITKSDLTEMLKKCLLATPKFAKFCVPLLLEKLDSDVLSAKMDSLEVLVESCSFYGIDELKPFFFSIWTAIRKELLSVKSEMMEKCCILAIKRLLEISSSSVTETGSHSTLEEFLGEIWKDCRPLLCQPEQKLLHPTSKLLCTLACTTGPSYRYLVSKILPLLLEQFHKVQQGAEKRNVLQALVPFLFAKDAIFHKMADDPLVVHRDLLLSLLFSLLSGNDDELKQMSLKGIALLIPRHGFLLESHLKLLQEHIVFLCNPEKAPDICEELKEVCSVIADNYPDVVRNCLLPVFMEKLEISCNDSETKIALDCLIALASHEDTMKPVVQKITTLILAASCESSPNVNIGKFQEIGLMVADNKIFRHRLRDAKCEKYRYKILVTCLHYNKNCNFNETSKDNGWERKTLSKGKACCHSSAVQQLDCKYRCRINPAFMRKIHGSDTFSRANTLINPELLRRLSIKCTQPDQK